MSIGGKKMAKRISVSIPDDMFEKLNELKDEFTDSMLGGKKISRRISSICQRALEHAIQEAAVSRIYRREGMQDGEKAADILAENDKKFIAITLLGEGPYRKWSRLERVDVLNEHFVHRYDVITPRFKELVDGKIILHDWVRGDSEIASDRRSEMAWAYIEGCYHGILYAYKHGCKSSCATTKEDKK